MTPSYHGLQFSHVGIYCLDKDKNPVVIEAFNGVTATPLADFMSRYRKNAPIVIGRLKPKYQNLIPEALSFAFSKIGMTYNSTFNINSTTSYYCAQLLYAAFKSANSGKPLFLLTPMTFKSKGSSNYMPVWREYFKNIDAPIPEGKLGINPDSILCSDKLDIFEYKL